MMMMMMMTATTMMKMTMPCHCHSSLSPSSPPCSYYEKREGFNFMSYLKNPMVAARQQLCAAVLQCDECVAQVIIMVVMFGMMMFVSKMSVSAAAATPLFPPSEPFVAVLHRP